MQLEDFAFGGIETHPTDLDRAIHHQSSDVKAYYSKSIPRRTKPNDSITNENNTSKETPNQDSSTRAESTIPHQPNPVLTRADQKERKKGSKKEFKTPASP